MLKAGATRNIYPTDVLAWKDAADSVKRDYLDTIEPLRPYVMAGMIGSPVSRVVGLQQATDMAMSTAADAMGAGAADAGADIMIAFSKDATPIERAGAITNFYLKTGSLGLGSVVKAGVRGSRTALHGANAARAAEVMSRPGQGLANRAYAHLLGDKSAAVRGINTVNSGKVVLKLGTGASKETHTESTSKLSPKKVAFQARAYKGSKRSIMDGTPTQTGDSSWTRLELQEGLRQQGLPLEVMSLLDGHLRPDEIANLSPKELARIISNRWEVYQQERIQTAASRLMGTIDVFGAEYPARLLAYPDFRGAKQAVEKLYNPEIFRDRLPVLVEPTWENFYPGFDLIGGMISSRGRAQLLYISEPGPHPGLTFLEEKFHEWDGIGYQDFSERKDLFPMIKFMSHGHAPVKQLEGPAAALRFMVDEAMRLPSYEVLENAERTGKIIHPLTGKQVIVAKDYATYLKQPHEIAARMFVQYTVDRSQSSTLLKELHKKSRRSLEKGYQLYWDLLEYQHLSQYMKTFLEEMNQIKGLR